MTRHFFPWNNLTLIDRSPLSDRRPVQPALWIHGLRTGLIALGLALVGGGSIAPIAQAQWQETQPDNRVARIRFRNDNTRSLYALYISPRHVDNWRDLLGSRLLKSGQSIDIELDYAELAKAGCDYRIKAIYADGSQAVLEDERYDLCNLRQVQFSPFAAPNANRPGGSEVGNDFSTIPFSRPLAPSTFGGF